MCTEAIKAEATKNIKRKEIMRLIPSAFHNTELKEEGGEHFAEDSIPGQQKEVLSRSSSDNIPRPSKSFVLRRPHLYQSSAR